MDKRNSYAGKDSHEHMREIINKCDSQDEIAHAFAYYGLLFAAMAGPAMVEQADEEVEPKIDFILDVIRKKMIENSFLLKKFYKDHNTN